MGSLHEFKKKKTANTIEAKIIEKIDESKFIIADEHDAMIMIGINDKTQSKPIVEGISVRIMKPKYIDQNTVEANENFKIMKIKPIEANIKPKVLKSLKELGASTSKTGAEIKLITFEELDQIKDKTEGFNLVVKVSSVSRAMDGKFSKFKLATIKDRQNMQNNLAIYPPHLDSLTPGKIYKLSVVKKTDYKKENENYNRLSTVRKADIKEFDDKKKDFKNVTVGECVLSGLVLGFGDVHEYSACKSSWMKVRESQKCEKHIDAKEDCQITQEFVTEIYIDVNNEVETLSGFRRHFGLNEQVQDNIEDELEKLVSKEVKIEYNIDQDAGGKKRIVEIKIL